MSHRIVGLLWWVSQLDLWRPQGVTKQLMEIYKYVDIDCHWPFLLKIDQADLCQHPNKRSNQSVIQSLAEELVFDLARQSCLLIWANLMCSVEFKAQLGLHINLSLLSIFCLSRRSRHINHLSCWYLCTHSLWVISVSMSGAGELVFLGNIL